MEKVLHRAETRGNMNYGWLNARHTFSFSRYYDPERVKFGLLRVLNDDIVAGGTGFDTHPHDNMEIVTIPIRGCLAHKDSTGGHGVIYPNEVQAMSAGSGLTHSEFNGSETEEVNLLQIWVLPKVKDIKPRYDQKMFPEELRLDKINTIVHPTDSNALPINQDAAFRRLKLSAGKSMDYNIEFKGNGVYIFLIDGDLSLADEILNARDGIGIYNTETIKLSTNSGAEIIFIEIPMQ